MEKVRSSPGRNWAETKSDRDKNWTIKLSPAIIQFEVWKLRDKSSGHRHVPTAREKVLKIRSFDFLKISWFYQQQVCVKSNSDCQFNVGCLFGVKFFFFLRPLPRIGQWLLTTVKVFYLVQCQCPSSETRHISSLILFGFELSFDKRFPCLICSRRKI